jgi:hypothetical protein
MSEAQRGGHSGHRASHDDNVRLKQDRQPRTAQLHTRFLSSGLWSGGLRGSSL